MLKVHGWAALILGAATIVATPAARAAAGNSRQGPSNFPNVTLTTHHGTQVRFYDDLLKGKSVAINLIYTTCQYSCPLETARLAQVQRLLGDRMGRDVFFYSLTIDPEHDTPDVLKNYAQKFHAGPGWLFLTGKQVDIDLISKKLGLYSPPGASAPDNHKPFLLVGNEATGQWMRQSAVDNAAFLATTIGDWLSSWRHSRREPLKSYAEMPRQRAFDKGQYTFATHCAACHTIGGGDQLGPDLLGVTNRRERGWLTRFILAPEQMNEQRDATAVALRKQFKQVRMPNLNLREGDAAILIDYLDTQSRAVRHAPGNLAAIVGPYLQFHESLSADSLQRLENQGRRLASAAATLGSQGASIRSAVAQLRAAADLRSARAAFAAVSEAILIYASEAKVTFGGDIKIAYCPMTRKYWLQKGETIRNPLHGKEMSGCGRLITALPNLTK